MYANKLTARAPVGRLSSLPRTTGPRNIIIRPAVAIKATATPAGAPKVVQSVIPTQTTPTAPSPVAEVDVDVLNKKLEAKAKALIALEEQEYSTRPMVRITMQRELALGEAWKVVGKVPELGSGVPEVAPYMQWSNGHVWTYEGRMRHGTWEYKLVLHKPDGAIVWELGPDRELVVSGDLGPEAVVEVKIDSVNLP